MTLKTDSGEEIAVAMTAEAKKLALAQREAKAAAAAAQAAGEGVADATAGDWAVSVATGRGVEDAGGAEDDGRLGMMLREVRAFRQLRLVASTRW